MAENEMNALSEVPVCHFCGIGDGSKYIILENEDSVEDSEWLSVLQADDDDMDCKQDNIISKEDEESARVCAWGGQVCVDGVEMLVSVAARESVEVCATSKNGRKSRVALELSGLSRLDSCNIVKAVVLGSEDDDEVLRLVLVDCSANILSVFLSVHHLSAQRARLLETDKLLAGRLFLTPGIPLTSQAVDFLSPSRTILALPPYLLAIDLDSHQFVPWSAHSARRAQSISSIFKEAKGILFAHEQPRAMDNRHATLPHTAALAVAQNVAFSLHADGSLRLWPFSSCSLSPANMACLRLPQHVLPSPHLWSHAQDSLLLAAHSDGTSYTLAMAIATHAISQQPHQHPTQHLAMLWGHLSDTDPSHTNFANLSVQLKTKKILDLKISNTARLQTLSLVKADRHDAVASAVITNYTSTSYHSFNTFTIDDADNQQLRRIHSQIHLYPDSNTNNEDIDAHALRLIFHHVRPHPTSVKRALSKLIPSFTVISSSAPTQTLYAMRQWSNMQPQLLHNRINQTTSSNTTDTDVYHAFVGAKTNVQQQQQQQETKIKEIAQDGISAQKDRWTHFLLAVCEEEALRKMPLCLATHFPSSNKTEAVIVRANMSSVMIQTPALPITTESPPAVHLDMMALSLLTQLRSDPTWETTLSSLEADNENIISKAALLSDSSTKETIQQQFGSLGASAISVTDTGQHIASILLSMHPDQINAWVTSSYNDLAPSIRTKLSPGFINLPPTDDTHNNTTNHYDVLASASYIVRQHLHSACDLYLARSLLVFGVNAMPHPMLVQQTGQSVLTNGHCILRMYLHALALRWTSDQLVSTESASSATANISTTEGTTQTHRRIHLRSSLTQQQNTGLSPTASPPGTRARYDHSSRASNSKKQINRQTVLDAHLAHLVKSARIHATDDSHAHLSCPAIFLAQNSLQSILPSQASLINNSHLPELMLLQYPTSTQDASSSSFSPAEPHLALRLLAPYIVYPMITSSSPSHEKSAINTMRIRREMAAECLFVETAFASQNQLWDCTKIAFLRGIASSLLLPQQLGVEDIDDDDGNVSMSDPLADVEIGFELLRNERGDDWVNLDVPPIDPLQETNLAGCLQSLLSIDFNSNQLIAQLQEEEEAPSGNVIRLSKIQTVQSLFMPWVVSYAPYAHSCNFAMFLLQTIGVDQLKQIHILARVLLKISDLMHRVSVVERHTATTTIGTNQSGKASSILSCKLLLSCVQDVISAVTRELPSKMYTQMPEYATLWSAEFRHALHGKEWDAAYRACFKNPIKERKMNNYRRLVLGMADAGALSDLLRLRFTLVDGGSSEVDGGDDGNSIDLYEFTAETLAGVAYEQALGDGRYEEGASSATTKPTNYAGCLYALHASRGDWRRAAQAMDAYGLTSHAAWKASSRGTSSSRNSSSSSGGNRFMDDLSLSAQGSAHAIHLVDKAHQFIVSGELGPHPFPALIDGEHTLPQSTGKKPPKRGREGTVVPSFTESEDGGAATDKDETNRNRSRIDRLLTTSDLTRRASRSLTLRTLQMDSLSPESITTILRASDRDVIKLLSRLGYYAQAISVAKVLREKRGEGRPKGLGLLFDSVRHILCKYIAPSAVRSLRPTPYNTSDDSSKERNDDPLDATLSSRPNAMQLHYATVADSSLVPAIVVGEHWKSSALNEDVMKGKLAMDLLRRYTTEYSSCQNTLALDVAGALLDLDQNRARLPVWLTELLSGLNQLGNMTQGGSSGLFANVGRSKHDHSNIAADPAGLARMYIKRGLYVEACDVISLILSRQGHHENEEKKEKKNIPSRLPEKGDIGYVPYNTIDMLWNIIEAAVSTMNSNDKKRALDARTRMEIALQKHFELARISEMGLQSARALVPA